MFRDRYFEINQVSVSATAFFAKHHTGREARKRRSTHSPHCKPSYIQYILDLHTTWDASNVFTLKRLSSRIEDRGTRTRCLESVSVRLLASLLKGGPALLMLVSIQIRRDGLLLSRQLSQQMAWSFRVLLSSPNLHSYYSRNSHGKNLQGKTRQNHGFSVTQKITVYYSNG